MLLRWHWTHDLWGTIISNVCSKFENNPSRAIWVSDHHIYALWWRAGDEWQATLAWNHNIPNTSHTGDIIMDRMSTVKCLFHPIYNYQQQYPKGHYMIKVIAKFRSLLLVNWNFFCSYDPQSNHFVLGVNMTIKNELWSGIVEFTNISNFSNLFLIEPLQSFLHRALFPKRSNISPQEFVWK